MDIVFEAIAEDRPGPKWRSVHDRHWHAYSRWFLRDGIRSRPTYLASLKSLKAHMPELLPAYEAIVEMAGGGDLEARFLSMWCPPTYVGGCSQAIVAGPTPVLIRNYDYSPQLIEGTWFASRLNGKRVLGVVDCLWGVLDGINEDGLAVSLAFGGRTTSGKGFGIPDRASLCSGICTNGFRSRRDAQAYPGAHGLYGCAHGRETEIMPRYS